jgi:hypothetical protein
MARKIIVLQTATTQSGCLEVRYALWLTPPTAHIPYRAAFGLTPQTSVVPDATADELAALASGSVVEVTGTASYLPGSKIAALGASMIAAYNKAQADLTGDKQWQFAGSSWDGTSWTVKGG